MRNYILRSQLIAHCTLLIANCYEQAYKEYWKKIKSNEE